MLTSFRHQKHVRACHHPHFPVTSISWKQISHINTAENPVNEAEAAELVPANPQDAGKLQQ